MFHERFRLILFRFVKKTVLFKFDKDQNYIQIHKHFSYAHSLRKLTTLQKLLVSNTAPNFCVVEVVITMNKRSFAAASQQYYSKIFYNQIPAESILETELSICSWRPARLKSLHKNVFLLSVRNEELTNLEVNRFSFEISWVSSPTVK